MMFARMHEAIRKGHHRVDFEKRTVAEKEPCDCALVDRDQQGTRLAADHPGAVRRRARA
jgi:hypothetical protein